MFVQATWSLCNWNLLWCRSLTSICFLSVGSSKQGEGQFCVFFGVGGKLPNLSWKSESLLIWGKFPSASAVHRPFQSWYQKYLVHHIFTVKQLKAIKFTITSTNPALRNSRWALFVQRVPAKQLQSESRASTLNSHNTTSNSTLHSKYTTLTLPQTPHSHYTTTHST